MKVADENDISLARKNWRFVQWVKDKFDFTVFEHHFYICIGQKRLHISVYYLTYRWVMTVLCFSSSVITLGDFGNPIKLYNRNLEFYFMYFVYLTNITLTLNTVTQIVGVTIITMGAKKYGLNNSLTSAGNVNCFRHTYWKLWQLTVMTSLTVTSIYWLLVYPNALSNADLNAHVGHTINAIYAFVDWWITGLPYNLSDVWIGWTYATSFFLFMYIYWLVGGSPRPSPIEERVTRRELYPGCSNFKHPLEVLRCCLMYVGVISLVHLVLCTLFMIKRRYVVINPVVTLENVRQS